MLKIKGFTFPEVIITIAIVGILAMVAVPVYRGYVRKGLATEGKALLAEISAAEQIYYARNGGFFATTTDANQNKAFLGVNATKNKYFTSYTVTVDNSGDFFTAVTKYNDDDDKTLTLVGYTSGEVTITDNFSSED